MYTLILFFVAIGNGDRTDDPPAPQPESYSSSEQCVSAGGAWLSGLKDSKPLLTDKVDGDGLKIYPIVKVTWDYSESHYECMKQ